MTGTHRNVPTISGDTTPAVRRARYRWLSGREPADLREAWRAESLSGGWSRPRDWWTPEVDGVTEACLAQGDGCLPACERLGRARAEAGVGLTEALDDLCALYLLLPVRHPPLPVVRALAEGWADASMCQLHVVTCEDPLTGLTSPAYLRTRLAEIYREAERAGTRVPDTHALLLVSADPPVLDGTAAARWELLRHKLAVGEAMRGALSGGETLTELSPSATAALVRRDDRLAPMLTGLRHRLEDQERIRAVRLWLERLPDRVLEAYELVAELARE